MKRSLGILALLLMAFPVNAMTTPVLLMNSPTNIGTLGNTSRDTPFHGIGGSSAAAVNSFHTIMPIAGTIGNLYVATPITLTQGSYTVTVYLNGVATAVSCSVSAGQNTCTDTTDTVHVAVGDSVTTRQTGAGTPDVISTINGSVSFTGDNPDESFIAGTGSNLPTTASLTFGPLGFTRSVNTSEGNVSVVMPTAGTIDQMNIRSGNTPNGAGNSWTFTLRQNSASTTITCTITNTATSCSDLTDSVVVHQGDILSVAVQGVGTPRSGTNADYTFRFKPFIDGESVMFTHTNTGLTVSADRYIYTEGDTGNGGTQAGLATILPTSAVWKKLTVSFDTAPGSGKSRGIIASYATDIIAGSFTEAGPACTLTNTDTTCTDNSNTVSLSAGNFITWISRPTNSPVSSTITRESAVLYVPPTSPSAVLSPSKFRIFGGSFKIVGGRVKFQ